jgi:hypothetical protein
VSDDGHCEGVSRGLETFPREAFLAVTRKTRRAGREAEATIPLSSRKWTKEPVPALGVNLRSESSSSQKARGILDTKIPRLNANAVLDQLGEKRKILGRSIWTID